MTATWDETGVDGAAEMAVGAGCRVIWACDGTIGYARPLTDGETVDAALAEFDAPYRKEGYEGHERYRVYDVAGEWVE